MSNKENNKNRSYPDEYDILHDEKFIIWRLFQTKESKEYWDTFLVKHPHLKELLHKAITQFNYLKINNYKLPKDDKKDIYRTILENIHRYKRRKTFYRIASAAAVLMIGVLFVLFFTHKGDNESLFTEEKIIGQRLPDKEICLISGEKVISLNQHAKIKLTSDGNASVTYHTNRSQQFNLSTSKMNKLVVPFGKRSSLILADGTKVWLNSGTELEFPSLFHDKTREIYIQGEIYLEVAQSDKKPFIVHTPKMQILVHGTSFNISAYKEDKEQSVVLVKGSVQVKNNNEWLSLSPNEMVKISEKKMEKETVDVLEHISWKGGVLIFNKTPMSEVLNKIGRYYNVEFESNSNVKLNKKTCSGKLFLSNNLDSVMTSISTLSSTTYKRNKQIINISKKNNAYE